jgi:hypothetical protein
MSLCYNSSVPPFFHCPHEGSSGQIVCGIFIAVMYIKLYGYYGPFKKDDDDVLQEMAQFQVFITLFISLLIRVGTYVQCCVSSLNRESCNAAESVIQSH